jgi:hypothetical protein
MSTVQQIKELEAQLKMLKAQGSVRLGKLTVKIGEKGNVLIYGLQRFPVSLYVNQIEKLVQLFNTQEFNSFLEDNKSKLASKESTNNIQ